MNKFLQRIKLFVKVLAYLSNPGTWVKLNYTNLLYQIVLIGPNSILVTMITAFFISLVLSLQIVKEFMYLNATNLVSSVLAISFIRELSPVLTSIIVIGKIGSFFTSEIATMTITEQVDALLIVGISPMYYLVLPRVVAVLLMLPMLNLCSLLTSFISSAFICSIFYAIDPSFFLNHYFIIFAVLIFLSHC